MAQTTEPAMPRGDEAELYQRHHRALVRSVGRSVNASRELIEDACQTAWLILLRRQPDRDRVFGWLRTVAIHEAYRLSGIERRDARLDAAVSPGAVVGADRVADARACLDGLLDARVALARVAALPPRQRRLFALQIAETATLATACAPSTASFAEPTPASGVSRRDRP